MTNLRAVLKLELIADDFFWHQKRGLFDKNFQKWLRYAKRLGPNKSSTWVARLIGLDEKFTFKREFVQPERDYSQANSTGSRGIYGYYALPPGIYEVNERVTWRRVRRYFIKVDEAEYKEIDREDVIKCLG
jgi:hypothetical protein